MNRQPSAPPDGHHDGRFRKFFHIIKRGIGRTSSQDPLTSTPSSPTHQLLSTTQPTLLLSPLQPVSNTTTLPSASPYQSILPSAIRPRTSSGSQNGAVHADRPALSTGLTMLKSVVSAVKEVSDAFPPLKAAAASFLIVLDRIDVRFFHKYYINS